MTHVHTYSSYSCQLAHACTICPHAQVSALLTSSCCNLISLTEELADFEVGSLTPEVEEDETLTSTHTHLTQKVASFNVPLFPPPVPFPKPHG